MSITPNLLRQIRETLANCAPFSNERQLRVLFVDPRINTWRDRLPTQTESFQELVNAVIDLLQNRHSAVSHENGLALFLDVVVEQIDEGDSCHQQVHHLATKLRAALQENPPPPLSLTPPPRPLPTILTLLETHFNESELKKLCLHLTIDYESLSGAGKADKARELILYIERRNRMADLIATGRYLRPEINWSTPATPAPATPAQPPPEPQTMTLTAQAGPLNLTLTGRASRWQLQVQNEGDLPLRQVRVVWPSPTVIVTPNRINLGGLEAGEYTATATSLVIRPNQQATSITYRLDFEVVFRTSEKIERHPGTFVIPIE